MEEVLEVRDQKKLKKKKKKDIFQVVASLVCTQARIGDILCMTYVS